MLSALRTFGRCSKKYCTRHMKIADIEENCTTYNDAEKNIQPKWIFEKNEKKNNMNSVIWTQNIHVIDNHEIFELGFFHAFFRLRFSKNYVNLFFFVSLIWLLILLLSQFFVCFVIYQLELLIKFIYQVELFFNRI